MATWHNNALSYINVLMIERREFVISSIFELEQKRSALLRELENLRMREYCEIWHESSQ